MQHCICYVDDILVLARDVRHYKQIVERIQEPFLERFLEKLRLPCWASSTITCIPPSEHILASRSGIKTEFVVDNFPQPLPPHLPPEATSTFLLDNTRPIFTCRTVQPPTLL